MAKERWHDYPSNQVKNTCGGVRLILNTRGTKASHSAFRDDRSHGDWNVDLFNCGGNKSAGGFLEETGGT